MRSRFSTLCFVGLVIATVGFAGQLCVALGKTGFTKEENVVIERNAVLKDLKRSNPAKLRQVMDEIQKSKRNPSRTALDQGQPSYNFDSGRNPDLQSMTRNSPQAAFDLFQLVKQAGQGKGTPEQK
jgi:hypothetical protein